jgi:hypothetical protein
MKYNFVKLTTLATSDDWDVLCDLERQAIEFFQTRHPCGYNLTIGGNGGKGSKNTRNRSSVNDITNVDQTLVILIPQPRAMRCRDARLNDRKIVNPDIYI